MKKFIKVTLIVVGSLFICVTAFAVYQFSQWDLSLFKQEWNETDGTVLANLSYGTAERNKFDLYLPAGIDKKRDNGIILFVHADSLEARYQRHGGTFGMIRFPNSGHELGRDSECVERLNKTVSDFAKKYFGY